MPYRIGTTTPLSEDDNVRALCGHDPRATYNPGAERLTTLAGTTVDTGYPRAVWTFSALTVAQWTDLRDLVGGYSGEVYVETRDDSDEFTEYRVIARLPEPRDLDRWGGYYRSVSVELILIAEIIAGPP